MQYENQHPQPIPEHIRDLIQSFLMTPAQSKTFLLREMGIAMVQNIFVIAIFIYLLSTLSWDQYTCNFALAIWLTMFGITNIASLVCKVFFLPQLAILKNPPLDDRVQKIRFIKELKKILSTNLYVRNSQLSQVLILHYFVGVLIIIPSGLKGIISPAECFVDNPIRILVTIIIITFIIKFYFTIQSNNRLEVEIISESQNAFIRTITYDKIDINKQSICSICLVDFDEIQPLSEYQCLGLHLFHERCIKDWLKTKTNQLKKCPYCISVPPEYE